MRVRGGLSCVISGNLFMASSPRAWFDKFSQVVQQIGFTRSAADSSLFIHRRTQGMVVLLVYVDDIVITGDDHAGIAKVKAHLSAHFHTKDHGSPSGKASGLASHNCRYGLNAFFPY